jgi:hypothetical protein
MTQERRRQDSKSVASSNSHPAVTVQAEAEQKIAETE